MKQVLRVLLLLTCYISFANAGPSLQVTQGWVQEGPPNARVLAGFMNINNQTQKPVSINSASSTSFKRVEFHRSINENGMARMRKQNQLEIKPGTTLKLEHGSYHLMLIQPTKRLQAGDRVNIVFRLSTGNTQSISLMVKKPADSQQGHQQHH